MLVVIVLGGYDRVPDVVWVAPDSTSGVLLLGCRDGYVLGLSAGRGAASEGAQVGQSAESQ